MKKILKAEGTVAAATEFVNCGSSLPLMTFEKMLFLAKGKNLFLM